MPPKRENSSLTQIASKQWTEFEDCVNGSVQHEEKGELLSPFALVYGDSLVCRAFILEDIMRVKDTSNNTASFEVSRTGKFIVGFLREIICDTIISSQCIPAGNKSELLQFAHTHCASCAEASLKATIER